MDRALTKGVDDYAYDTDQRVQFVKENQHLFSGTMLVAVFSYLESTLGSNWIKRCGGKQERELENLRFVRNAFVHSNSLIRDLNTHTDHLESELRSFICDLENGKIKDGKGNVYPVYMSISPNGEIELNRHAINIFRALCQVISH